MSGKGTRDKYRDDDNNGPYKLGLHFHIILSLYLSSICYNQTATNG